jgi:2-amino-4-hydroxy-6-hydroxymethyldihydropteridine diphosphokinase
MIFIGVGSSIGNAKQIFADAEAFLKSKAITVVRKATILKNPAFGGVAQNEFSNSVWEIKIPKDMTPEKLLKTLKEAESNAGRNFNAPRWSDRELDLDILLFHDQVIETETLSIPHPGIPCRDFVLTPLTELVDETFEIPTLGAIKDFINK